MLCVTRRGSSRTCCSVRVVANIIMQRVWRLVPHPSSGQGGSAQIVKCARLAGKSGLKTQPLLLLYYTRVHKGALSHNACMMFTPA